MEWSVNIRMKKPLGWQSLCSPPVYMINIFVKDDSVFFTTVNKMLHF